MEEEEEEKEEREEERGPNNKAIYHVAREEREGSMAAYFKEQGLPDAISVLKEGMWGFGFHFHLRSEI